MEKKYLYDVLKEISTIYADFVEYTEEGAPTYFGSTQELKFDLKEKSIWIDEYYYILNHGKLVRNEISLSTGEVYLLDETKLIDLEWASKNPYGIIEDLFYEYYHSMPTIKEKQRNHYFKFKPTEQVGLKEMEMNLSRVQTRYALEAFVVLASASGLIPWKNDEHFFWRSEREPDLILYKSWIA